MFQPLELSSATLSRRSTISIDQPGSSSFSHTARVELMMPPPTSMTSTFLVSAAWALSMPTAKASASTGLMVIFITSPVPCCYPLSPATSLADGFSRYGWHTRAAERPLSACNQSHLKILNDRTASADSVRRRAWPDTPAFSCTTAAPPAPAPGSLPGTVPAGWAASARSNPGRH
ncbi:hypothetical protein D3C79_774290 [compost metagenome]